MKLRFSLRTLLLMVLLCALALAIPYWIPKSEVLSFNEAYVGYYRGLGLTYGSGYFGRDWYYIVVRHEYFDGYWEVDVDGLGYNPYRGYYGTGVLREEGLCMVEPNGFDIMPVRENVWNAKYYDPNGQLVSEVKNGTGKQILCCPNGQPAWELDLVDAKYAHLKMWHDNGQLVHESHYRDGWQDGVAVGYHPNGQLKYRGEYLNRKHSGVWTYYAEDGSIERETDYDAPDDAPGAEAGP